MPISHRKLVPHQNNKWQASSLYQKYMLDGTRTLGNSISNVKEVIDDAAAENQAAKVMPVRPTLPTTSIVITRS